MYRLNSRREVEFAKKKSTLTFVELTDEIYLVEKDRRDGYKYFEYTTTNQVVQSLNYSHEKVVVIGKNGKNCFANFEPCLRGGELNEQD